MTRTEAIDLLDNLIGMVDDNHESDYDTALDMAIKALEYDDAKYHEEHGEVVVDKAVWEDAKRALEQEPSGDAVSRQAVFDQIYEWMNTCEYRKVNATDYFVNRINKLPSVNPQACEDAISREAVDDILCLYSDGNGMIDAGGAVRMVRELPSVNPQEKIGHWIYKPKTDLSICDKCGSYCPQDKYGRIETDFCPKCGARMVEPQESEEI